MKTVFILGRNEPGPPDARVYVHHDVHFHVDLQHGHHGHDDSHSQRRGQGHQL